VTDIDEGLIVRLLEEQAPDSGAFTGRTKLTVQGRPGLRLAAWRAVWGAQRANPVYRARYQQVTSRDQNKLRPTQAQTVIAAAILRQPHAVITTGQARESEIATHGTRRETRACSAIRCKTSACVG
jgi:transposase